jgi:hypothetical protein
MEQALPFVPYVQAAVPWTAWGPQQPVYPAGLPAPARQGFFLPRQYARKVGSDMYDIGWRSARFFSNEYGGPYTDYSAYTTSGLSDFTSGFRAPRGNLFNAHNNIWYQPQDWLHYGIKGVDQYRQERPFAYFTQQPSWPGTPPFWYSQPYPGAPTGRAAFAAARYPWSMYTGASMPVDED